MCGEEIIKSIAVMHDRSNGLGGGFAAYGIYPEYKDCYALHIFYDSVPAKKECEDFFGAAFRYYQPFQDSDAKNQRDYRRAVDLALFRRAAADKTSGQPA